MKKIKVIEFIRSLGDGGAETLVKEYCQKIDKEKFDILVMAIRDFGYSANSEKIKTMGIKIIYIYNQWNLCVKLWNKTMGFWYIPFKVKKILKEEKPDVLHIHLALLSYVRRIEKSLKNVRLFFTCHSIVGATFGKVHHKETMAAKDLIKNKNLRLIALQSEMAKELDELFNIKNTVVIRNGVDFDRFKNPGVNKKDERNSLNIPQDAFVIGHVGRFNPVKNHDFLVEVFREVSLKKDNAFLLMVGAGVTSGIIQKLNEYGLQDRFLILSHRNDVNRILKAMDVFVFPSIYEGLGIAVIEAQVSGLKCIASDVLPKDAFRSEKIIALPLGDARQWADTILDERVFGDVKGDINDYNMKNEIKRLEYLYAGGDI